MSKHVAAYEPRPMMSGDLCRFITRENEPYPLVEHYRCDDYRDGTITDPVTGSTVKDAPYNAPRGFTRP